jgi:hypothetical protein
MRTASYVFARKDSGSFFFRWVIPSKVRPLLGGRREVKRSLHTDQRRVALRLARRLSVVLERATAQLMASQFNLQQEGPAAHLIIQSLERLVDGTLRIEGMQLDPQHIAEEKELLAALLGTAGTAANAASPDQRTLEALVAAYFAEGDREKRWTAKTRSELDAIYKLMLEILGPTKPVADIARKDAAYLKDMLAKLPSNRNKDPRYRTKSVLELASMKIPQEDLLSVSSANKALIRVSSLFKYGVQHGWIASNPAEGMTFRAPSALMSPGEQSPMPCWAMRLSTAAQICRWPLSKLRRSSTSP